MDGLCVLMKGVLNFAKVIMGNAAKDAFKREYAGVLPEKFLQPVCRVIGFIGVGRVEEKQPLGLRVERG
jgi:hypothetical protein